MDKIIIVDNFLNEDEITTVHKIVDNSLWDFNHYSNGNKVIETPFWTANLTNEVYISEYIKTIIEAHFFKKFELLRVYANGQTFGQDGVFHIDTEDEDCYTFCLYVNKIKKEDIELAAGYIYFKIPELNYQICYEPINNRGLFFPSNYLHKASAFSRFIKDLRICISWKMKLKK